MKQATSIYESKHPLAIRVTHIEPRSVYVIRVNGCVVKECKSRMVTDLFIDFAEQLLKETDITYTINNGVVSS